jgi:hypothetical protein
VAKLTERVFLGFRLGASRRIIPLMKQWQAQNPTLYKSNPIKAIHCRDAKSKIFTPRDVSLSSRHIASHRRNGPLFPAKRTRSLSNSREYGLYILTQSRAESSSCHRNRNELIHGIFGTKFNQPTLCDEGFVFGITHEHKQTM